MLQWIPYAFVRIAISFIAGVLLAIYYPLLDREAAIIIAIVCCGGYLVLFVLLRKKLFYFHYWLAVAGFVTTFFLGYACVLWHNQALDNDHLLNGSGEIDYYTVFISKPPVEKENTYQYEAELMQYQTSGKWCSAKARMYIYLRKDTLFAYGDELLIHGQPNEIEPPKNPYEFDYKQFLSYKNIYHQSFVRQGDYFLVGHDANAFFKRSYQLRLWAVQQLEKNIRSQRELGIVKALVLGLKDDVDDEVQQAYAASGAMHVLAVSGLHVGIIYLLITVALGSLKYIKYGPWLLAFISLLLLWAYAMLTGFSASVLRATTMFTAIIIAQATGRQTNIYNTLSVSAFVLLLFDPYLIMSVGFQLSYLAVLGIVYVQPKLYGLYVFDSKLADWAWGITTVSLAAQLATFPLGIYYFHQFPTYFFLSNIIVIPGALIVLCGGLGVIFIGAWELGAYYLGLLVQGIVWLINTSLFYLKELPFSQITDIHFSAVETVFIIAAIVTFLLLFQVKKVRLAYFSLVLASLFSVVRVWDMIESAESKVVFYDIQGQSVIDFFADHHLVAYEPEEGDSSIDFHVSGNRLSRHLDSKILCFNYSGYRKQYGLEFILWKETLFVILSDSIPDQLKLAKPGRADVLVISKGFQKSLTWVNDNFDYDQLIIDSAVNHWRRVNLEKEAQKLQVECKSVNDGAVIIDI
ncbi:ComEC/Rec2 family competence protein [Fulvivirga sediminis]|uniref:ComEC/Rec2 family competence protein n=1 Tax=Fulvivirga sediminis TaxID=2803949 RepID=A0A937F8P0_9BACT|nr:ComEC/Rec2 family competence protein [Fulvivirga sediminis]MBL3658517.1 ComEC/Rec2 family competence protein [Fulvivirga sediminis]